MLGHFSRATLLAVLYKRRAHLIQCEYLHRHCQDWQMVAKTRQILQLYVAEILNNEISVSLT